MLVNAQECLGMLRNAWECLGSGMLLNAWECLGMLGNAWEYLGSGMLRKCIVYACDWLYEWNADSALQNKNRPCVL